MAHMEDKDFDRLFKDQFEGAEITPSANLWSNIEKELSPKKKVVLPAYWMAAAVVAIAIMVGLLRPKSEPIRLRGSADVVASTLKTDAVAPSKIEEQVVSEEKQEEGTPLVIAARLNENDVKKDFATMQPIVESSHPVNMEVQSTPAVIAQVASEAPVDDVMMARVETPQQAAVSTEEEQPERKGIRNVGDIINIVVNKVDKRDKKLIQFNTDEDDNSSVVAINIGFLRFNKRDK
jgi:hypothetical protein